MGKRLLIAAALLLATAVPAFASDLAGVWTLTMTGPQGEEKFDITFAPSGDGYAVTGTHPILGDVEGKASLDGDAIAMTFGSTGDMKVDFTFEGTVDGDSMAGTREYAMAEGGGAAGGAPPGGGDAGGAPPGGGDMGGAPEGAPPAGGAPEGGAPPAGAPEGGPPGGGEAPAGGAPGGAPGGGDMAAASNDWSAVRKG